MKSPVHFFLGSSLLGSSAIEMEGNKHGLRPLSTAYFCPECGEVWARAMIPGQKWEVWHLHCEKHELPYPFRVPGSMWIPWERTFNDALPRVVLEREFYLHLAVYDRFKEMYDHAE